ncbi:MAG: Very short patch repair protein [Nitrospira sp.]|nr:Very short patch repair protein [Nitrospira sp.]
MSARTRLARTVRSACSEEGALTDIVDRATRSRMMSGIRGKDTKAELVVRRMLFGQGFRFRLHRRDLPGRPDVVLPSLRITVFIHGCFWHRHNSCGYAKLPSTRPEFWKAKLEGNVVRDDAAVAALRALGWRVLVVWECAVRDKRTLSRLPRVLSAWIRGHGAFCEIRGPASLSTR